MEIGVISDSHGDQESVLLAAKCLIEERQVKTIIHLGDDYEDARLLEAYPVKIINVPGVYSDYYQDPCIPNRLIKTFRGWKTLISHTIKSHYADLDGDLVPEVIIVKRRARVVLYGHTHIPAIEEKDGVLYFNPGHLRIGDKRGHQPTYGLIDFEKDKITARIFYLNENKELYCNTFTSE